MYLSSVVFNNIRGFSSSSGPMRIDFEREDGSFAGWTVIAGRNGSGKTTLLRAIAIALVGKEVSRTLMPSGFAGWISHGAEDAFVQASFTVGVGDVLSEAGARPKGRSWTGLKWLASPEGPIPVVLENIPDKARKQTARRGPWAENPRGFFVAGYGPFRRLSGAAPEAQRAMLGSKRTASLVTLFDETASLAESTWWLQELYPRTLEHDDSATELLEAVKRLLDDGLLPDGSSVINYDSRGLIVRQNGLELVVTEMSDGYRVVTALVLDIVRRIYAAYGKFELVDSDDVGKTACFAEGVVLIDEVDVHLHVSWQQRIGFWLREHFPNIQFIVSTHSPFITQAASSRGLIRLASPGAEERNPAVVEEPEFSKIVNGGADNAVVSALFGLESSLSELSLEKRAKWRAAEDSVAVTGSEEADELREQLGVTPSDEIIRILKALADDVGTTS